MTGYIAHYAGSDFTGTITPGTESWRNHSLDFERRYAHHYEIKERRRGFLIVEPGEIPPEKIQLGKVRSPRSTFWTMTKAEYDCLVSGKSSVQEEGNL